MVISDAVLRKLPGALGDAESAVEESYSEALDGRAGVSRTTPGPPTYRGWEVPEILLSGDHARVREWRLEQARHRARMNGRHKHRAASPLAFRVAARGPRARAFFELRPAPF